MSEISAVVATADDVRGIGRRRNLDDLSIRLELESAERGTAWAVRDAGETVGLAVAHDSKDERYIGDLFVEPSFRGQGLGRRLLDAASGATEDCVRAMLVDPRDAASVALALRFGMATREAVLRFAGSIPKEEDLAKMAVGDYRFEVGAIDAIGHGMVLNELDRRTRGTIRPEDHLQFAQTATGQAFFLRGECVAYAYVWPDGRIGPIASVSEAYLVQLFAYALVTLHGNYGASWCTLLVPGSNRRVARAALRAGLRIQESYFFAADSFIGDMSTYVGYHQLLL